MEHRNSTVITSSGSIRASRDNLLDTVAHEFFIAGMSSAFVRDRSNRSISNASTCPASCGWPKVSRSTTVRWRSAAPASTICSRPTATLGRSDRDGHVKSGREVRSAEEMSRMAPFTDGGRTSDRTNWSEHVSFRTIRSAARLRSRSTCRCAAGPAAASRSTISCVRCGGCTANRVARAKGTSIIRTRSTMRSGDWRRSVGTPASRTSSSRNTFTVERFRISRSCFSRRVSRSAARTPGRAWWGDVRIETRNGARIASSPLANTPAYKAGLDVDDVVRQLDGTESHPQRTLPLCFDVTNLAIRLQWSSSIGVARRPVSNITLAEDPQIEVVATESLGRQLSASQRTFRRAWLGAVSIPGADRRSELE